jgi:hypothetical protein
MKANFKAKGSLKADTMKSKRYFESKEVPSQQRGPRKQRHHEIKKVP